MPFTAAFNVAPALNAGALEALILRAAPVAGLRPLRAARLRKQKGSVPFIRVRCATRAQSDPIANATHLFPQLRRKTELSDAHQRLTHRPSQAQLQSLDN